MDDGSSVASTQASIHRASVREALHSGQIALTAAGCSTPRLDAELLLADALGVSRERLIVEPEMQLGGEAVRRFRDHVRRRSALREPVAYILGRRHFRRLTLTADARALIPRPESELLVEVGLTLAHGARVLDLGTGSGAIALALADERPDLEVTASDLSAEALALARENAAKLGLRVAFLQADLLEGLPDAFEAILANLPYVPSGDRARLEPEITRHEPSGALFAGEDGLLLVRRLVAQVQRRGGVRLLALEIGAGQAPVVAELMRAAGLPSTRSERDLAGIERVVVGERR
jgi:release factor glutamine methyltransferase